MRAAKEWLAMKKKGLRAKGLERQPVKFCGF